MGRRERAKWKDNHPNSALPDKDIPKNETKESNAYFYLYFMQRIPWYYVLFYQESDYFQSRKKTT